MWMGIVSLFPEMFKAVSEAGITGRAVEQGILQLEFWNPRDFADDRHRTVDDKPYGGGPGMLMKVAPLRAAIAAAKAQADGECEVILLSPQGERVSQAVLNDLAQRKRLILVAGRYEGIDERVVEHDIDHEYSVGDYVVSGGELPAMIMIDGVTRLLPGAVGDVESVARDSFMNGLLDYPQYTRPAEVDGIQVPEVLLSGDHAAIERWRKISALGKTFERRPDLLAEDLGQEDKKLLEEYLSDRKIKDDHNEQE